MKKNKSKLTPEVEALSPEAQKLHARLTKEWNLTDGAGQITLLTACQSLDRLREAQAVLKAEGCITKDRFGCPKAHPASTIEREARAGLLACMKMLNLDLESLEVDDDATT